MRSLNSRFIAIFIILVLVTVLIFGALFVRFSRKYDMKVITNEIDHSSELILPNLNIYDNLEKNMDKITSYIYLHAQMGFREQVFVVHKNKILASITKLKFDSAEDILDSELLINAETGKVESKICLLEINGEKFRTYDKTFPIINNNKQVGILYIKYDLADIDKSSANSLKIILQSLVISLTFSLLLAIFIASSITKPINKLTDMASKIATGNFDEKIQIKSDDEIGTLSKTFNYMADKLSDSLGETYREKNKMEAIVNNIVDGIIAVDQKGEILHINPAASVILKQNNIVDNLKKYSDFSNIFSESLSFDNLMKFENINEFRENFEYDDFYYEVRCEHFYDERGSKKGFILIFQDITKEAKLEKMRRDFIANVSHELKTPITSVKGYSETMLAVDDIDRETTKSFLTVINDEADRMSILVNDLLHLSSLDAGKVELKINSYNWNEFLKKLLKRFDMQFKKEKIEYTFVEKEKSIIGDFDYEKMERVVSNLITNAIKYTEKNGSVKITLNKEKKFIYLSVKDTGIGISNDDLSKLFDRFYRVEKSRQRKAGGSGLGLSIVKQILDLHKASISVKSELKKGSEFIIKIPVKYEI